MYKVHNWINNLVLRPLYLVRFTYTLQYYKGRFTLWYYLWARMVSGDRNMAYPILSSLQWNIFLGGANTE